MADARTLSSGPAGLGGHQHGQVLVLVGLHEGADIPVAAVERVDAAAVEARQAGVRVVHLSETPGGEGEDIAHPDLPRGPRDLTVTGAPGAELGEAQLDAILSGVETVALAGTPTSGLVARLALRRVRVIVLADACDDPDLAAHGTVGDLMDTDDWISLVRAGRPGHPQRRVVSAVATGVVLMALIVVGVVANNKAGNYYLLSPGSAPLLTSSSQCRAQSASSIDLTLPGGRPCARISVPSDQAHPITGSLFMVDVLEGRASWSDYLLHRLHLLKTFHDGSQLLPASAILGGTPPDQLSCQNNQEMVQATTDAPVAALQTLGYNVHQRDLGAQIDLVMPNLPAAAAGLACNDVITAVNGQPVQTVEEVTGLLAGAKPGTAVSLQVSAPAPKGAVDRTVKVRLTSTPAEAGSPAQPTKGFLGVELATKSTYALPFNVSVNVGDIGGPSAGLAITLGIIDLLSNGQLTGGHQVAATGTIAPNGAVGDVGGVAQKTVAVRKAGAQVFLVPPEELTAARSEAGGTLKVYAVSSLQQALAVLSGLGGHVPTPAPS